MILHEQFTRIRPKARNEFANLPKQLPAASLDRHVFKGRHENLIRDKTALAQQCCKYTEILARKCTEERKMVTPSVDRLRGHNHTHNQRCIYPAAVPLM